MPKSLKRRLSPDYIVKHYEYKEHRDVAWMGKCAVFIDRNKPRSTKGQIVVGNEMPFLKTRVIRVRTRDGWVNLAPDQAKAVLIMGFPHV